MRSGVVRAVERWTSGVALTVGVTKSQEASAVIEPIERVLQTVFSEPCNVPEGLELRTDHGPQYTAQDWSDRTIHSAG